MRLVAFALAWPAAVGLLVAARRGEMLMSAETTLFTFTRRWPRPSLLSQTLVGWFVAVVLYAVVGGLGFMVLRGAGLVQALAVTLGITAAAVAAVSSFMRAAAAGRISHRELLAVHHHAVERRGEIVDLVPLYGARSSGARPALAVAADRADYCLTTLAIRHGILEQATAALFDFVPLPVDAGVLRRNPEPKIQV